MISSFSKFTLINLGCIVCTSSLYALQDAAVPPAPAEKIAAKQSLAGTIYFLNGDSISGQLNNWNMDQVMITSPDLVDTVSFSTAKILNITLKDNRDNAIKAETNQDETTLIINHRDNQKGLNGVIKGGFSNIDDQHVTLKTNYAGEIKVLKKFVTRMEIDSKKGYLYQGPKSLEEWHNNSINHDWKYINDSLISGSGAGNIAQDLALPGAAILNFDLSWKDDEYITLYLFSSDPEQSKPDNYYQLTLRKGRCTLLKYVNGRQVPSLTSELQQNRNNQFGNQFRIQVSRSSADEELNAHFEVYMSKEKGEFHIFRNGVKMDSFTDSKPQAEKFGTSLHLVSSVKTPVRIQNLNLSKWNGHIPSVVDAETFAKIKGEGQRILLKNGDILLGKIGEVRDGIMQIETLYAPFNVPIVRMRSIDLTGANLKEEPIMYENDIKCWFKNKGWIILKPISIDGNTLTAYHQALGENKFDLNIFKRIDLHIYDKEANASRKSDSW